MSKKLLFDVGLKDLAGPKECPFYMRWKGILRRCYQPSAHDFKRYEGCKVSSEWLLFSNFKRWMELQPWEGNHLDKDILRPWEKRYCPETSVFVPHYINTIMGEKPAGGSGLPAGVTRSKRGRPFIAMIRRNGSEKICLGTFLTAKDAHRAWAEEKANHIEAAIERYKLTSGFDIRVCEALYAKALQLRSSN